MEFDRFIAWRQHDLGGSPLIAYRLRELFPSRWVRFHSLPHSKRYADTPEELAEIHHRHDTIAAALLGEGEPIVIVRTGFSETATPAPPEDGDAQWPSEDFTWFETRSTTEIDDDDCGYAHFWLAHSTFRPAAFHLPWTLLANDIIDNVLFINIDRRCIFAPYDGGMDLIAADTFVCDALRRDFQRWLSPHPTGL